MRTASYIEALTAAGVDAKIAQAHGKAFEQMIDEKFVTKDFLDAKLSDLKATLFQAMFVQAIGIIGLVSVLAKLVLK